MSNGLAHHFHLDKSTFIFREIRVDFFTFQAIPLSKQNIAPDGTPRSAVSDLGYTVCICPINRQLGLM